VDLDFRGPGGEALRRSVITASAEREIAFMLQFQPDRVVVDPEARLFRWTPARSEEAALREALAESADLARQGTELLDTGKRRLARRAFERALGLDPDQPLARLGLGRLRVLMRDVEESRELLLPLAGEPLPEVYRDLAWVRPWAEVWVGRGWDLRRDRKKALDAYRRALELPDDREAHRAAREGIAAPWSD
jgi:tetratricopeptide (TPR) repeat protein